MIERKISAENLKKAARVKLLLMDCDGVLTDGRLYYSGEGELLKVFHVRDGQGLVNWHRAGFDSGIITGRGSKILELRAAELGIRYLHQNAADKAAAFENILLQSGLTPEQTAYIGDDLIDLAVLRKTGFSAAVADADESLFGIADYSCEAKGGFGAVREVIEILLQARESA